MLPESLPPLEGFIVMTRQNYTPRNDHQEDNDDDSLG